MKITQPFQTHAFTACLLGLAALLVQLAAPSAFAAGPYYWDCNTNTAGFGTAGGTWSATTTPSATQGWSTDSTGASALTSVTTATTDTSENFGSVVSNLLAGTVTVSGTVNSGPIIFGTNSGAIVLSGGTITLPATASITVSNTAGDTINSILSGAATSLTVAGPTTSSLTLSGANNYGGTTLLTGPRVAIGAATYLPSGSAVTISSGAQLYFSAAFTFANNFNISGNGFAETGGSGNVGAIRMSNGDILTNGVITLGGNSRIGYIAGNTFSVTISDYITGSYGLDYYADFNNTTTSKTATFLLQNTGTANDYTGNTTIYAAWYGGTTPNETTMVKLGASEQIPNGPGKGILVLAGSAANWMTTFELNGFNETVNGISAAQPGFTNTIQNTATGASTLTVGDANTNSSFSGNILDGGTGKTLAITKIGTGTLTLSGSNAFTAGLTVSAGTLEADNANALGYGLLVMNGGALSNNVSATLTNNINLAVVSTVGVGTSQTLTLGGVITNTGSLTMVGAGNLILTNANSYSGGTFANGTVYMKNNLCFGTGTVTVNTGGQAYNAYNPGLSFTITNSVTLNGGQLHTGGGQSGTKITWSGPVTLTASSSMSSDGGTTGNAFAGGLNLGNSGYTLTVNGNGPNDGFNANNFNSVISGGPSATFQVGSSGVAYLNAANTFSGTNRSGFSLVLKNVNALQNATLDMNAADSGTVTLINNAVIGALTGSRNLSLSSFAVSIGNNNSSTAYGGVLGGTTGTLTKIGTGTLTLSGANTFTNSTTISGGTLALSGSGSLASTNITVAGGATLDVSALSSTFALASGQTLANSGATTATLNGSANTGSGKVTLAYASGTPSLKVNSGTLTLSGSTTFTVNNTGSILQAGTYTNILANGGTVAGTMPSVVVTGNGAVGLPSLSIDGSGNLILNVQNTGWSGAVSTSWTTAGNWSSGTVPNPGDPINFNSSSTNNLNTVLNASFGISTLNLTVPTGPVSIAAGGAYTLSITNGINLSSATNDLTITAPVALGGGQTWSVTNTHTLSVNGGVSGSAALTVSGGGKVSLGGAATYTGDTTVSSGGTLQMGAANVLPNGAGVGNMYVFGTLDLNGGNTESVNALNGTGIADNTASGAATLTVGNNNASNTNFTGTIQNTSGTLSLVKAGSGSLTLSGTNTYSGGTALNGGVLTPANGSAFGNGLVTVSSGATAYPVASLTFTNAFVLNGGTLRIGGGGSKQDTYTGPVSTTVTSTTTNTILADGGTGYSVGAQTGGNWGSAIFINGNLDMGSTTNYLNTFGQNGITINGSISGDNGTIMNTSSGTYLWLANASNSFAGTIRAQGGWVILGYSGANSFYNATVDMNAADSGSFYFKSYPLTIGGLMGSRNLNLGGAVSIGNNNTSTTFSGALTNSGSLTKNGTGTLTLSGANTYTGNTTISAGTLALSSSGTLASLTISVAGSATFDASTASFTLGAGQVLSNTASATASLVGPLSSGSGTISVSFVNGTPSFNVTDGTLNLSASTILAVNNTGAALTPGTYKIISKSGGGAVSGTAPTSVSVVNGPTAGTPSVSIVGGELYLTVGGTSTFGYTGASFTYNGLGQSPAISFSGSTAAKTTNFVGVFVSYGPSVSAPTNVGTYYVTNTVASDANYFGATNSQSFTISAAALGITASDASKSYGQTVTFVGTEFTSSGLVGGDSVSSVTLTSAGATNTATPGSYAIVSSAAIGSGLDNYAVSYTNGTLTVNPATTSVGASSTMNPSGYKDAILFIATLPADASGNVIFSSTNGPISTNSVTGASTSSLSISNLLRGTNLITVAYLGDSNYVGSTNSLNQIVTNHPPVVNPASYTRNAAVNQIKIAVTNLLSNATDVDGDALALASVSATTNGVTLIVSGGLVMYNNTNAVADEFTYTVSDGYGGTNSATVTLAVDSTPLFGQSVLASTTGGTATLSFAGIPTYSYSVLRSTNLTSWAAIWTTNAPGGGVFQFIDPAAPQPSAYYQLQFNP